MREYVGRKAMGAGLALALACFTPWAAFAEEAASGGQPVELFNGKDFQGWKLFIPEENVDPASVWEVAEGGVLHCNGKPAGYIRTTAKHRNYELTFEWRYPAKAGNSGVLLHVQEKDEVWPKSIEAQLMSENAGDMFVIGGTEFKEHLEQEAARKREGKDESRPEWMDRRVAKKQPHSEKPLGEWNRYRIVCDGDSITLYVNDQEQNRATECTVSEGYIGLQSEGVPIEYRNIRLAPLK